ncbi:MAG: hypothetical protein KGL39_54850 [Patescibacteria group bacterium]|nr:hypothetical protein [Patescibacteria group bacterium]
MDHAQTAPGDPLATLRYGVHACLRCHEPVDLSLLAGKPFARLANGNIEIGSRDALVLPGRGIYCLECCKRVRQCKVCGCTDEAACLGGCSWAARGPGKWGICSSCAGRPGHEVPTSSGEIDENVTDLGELDDEDFIGKEERLATTPAV